MTIREMIDRMLDAHADIVVEVDTDKLGKAVRTFSYWRNRLEDRLYNLEVDVDKK